MKSEATDTNPETAAVLKTDTGCILEPNAKLLDKSSDKEANDSSSQQIRKDPEVSNSSTKPKTDEPNNSSGTITPGVTPPEEEGGKSSQVEATFPQQLMDVIEQETKDGTKIDGERVIEWLPAGDAFIIRDKAILEKDVLPRYFSAKCKFMSFVRKLYRWGFHQVEKSQTRAMVFMHAHFARGDKKRCLMMRSIVKKPAAQQPRTIINGANHPAHLSTNMLQRFGSNSQYGGMGGGAAFNFNMIPPLFPQQARQVSYSGTPNQGGDNGIMNSNGMGRGVPPSLFMPNQFPQGMTSTDMFEAGLCLERMEQRQQQRQNQMMDMLNDNGGNSPAMAAATTSSFNQAMSQQQPQMPISMSSEMNGNNSNFGGDMSQVDLATQILKRDPSMEPWRALELAKSFQQ